MKKLQEWDDCERSVWERHARAETAKGMEIYFLTECSTKAGQLGMSFQKLLKMERKQIHWKKESFLEEIQEGNVHSRFNIVFNTHRLKKNKEISKQKKYCIKTVEAYMLPWSNIFTASLLLTFCMPSPVYADSFTEKRPSCFVFKAKFSVFRWPKRQVAMMFTLQICFS